MSEIFDEASYVKYAESVIFDLQRCFRTKPGFENVPVIEMSAMLEELCFHQALIENAPVPSVDHLWLKRECIYQYQHQCEKMLRNLDAKERNWKKILEENEKNAKIVLSAIMKDDEAGRRKVEAYRPKPVKPAVVRLPPAERLKNLTSGTNKTAGSKGKGGSKKGPIGKRKVGASAAAASSALLNASINWQSFGASATVASTATTSVSVSMVIAPDSLMSMTVDAEDDFNLDMFDDEGGNSIHLSNAEAWQAPAQGQEPVKIQAVGVNDGSSGQVWRSAIAEQEFALNRERELKQHRETQQDALRKARDEGMQSAVAKREEEEYTSRTAAEREMREKLEAQQLRDETRERERKAREDSIMAVDMDSGGGLLDEMDF